MKLKFIIGIISLCIFISSCGGGNSSTNTNKNSNTNSFSNSPVTLYTDYKQQLTPDSPIVYSKNGESDEFLGWVDESLNKLNQDIIADNRTPNYPINKYSIYANPDCVLSPIDKVPSFLLRADDYDGSIYDKDPRPGVHLPQKVGMVYAAEYVLQNADNTLSNGWIVCDSTDKVYVENAVRYGGEHVYLYNFNRNEYEATKNHATGPPHPLIKEQ